MKTLEEHIEEITKLYGFFPYEIIKHETWIGNPTLVHFKCKKCGYEFTKQIGELKNECKKLIKRHPDKKMYVCATCNNVNRNKTLEDYKKLISETGNMEFPYEILNPEDYKNSLSMMNLKCKKCGYEFTKDIATVYSTVKKLNQKEKSGKYLCRNCNIIINNQMVLNNTTRILDDYIKDISELYNGYFPYEILNPEDYLNSKSILSFKCKKCGTIFKRGIGDLYYKCRENSRKNPNSYVCKGCAKIKNKLFHEKRIEEAKIKFFNLINKHYPDQYDFLSDYKGHDIKIKVKCKTCNNIFEVTPGNILNNIRLNREHYCPYCTANKLAINNSKPISHFEEKLIKKEGKLNYKLERVKGDIFNIECLICGYNFQTKITGVISAKGHVCPKCNNMIRDKRPYPERVKDIHNGTITPLEDYINRKTPIKHKCLVCNSIWEPIPGNILKGEGCPLCNKAGHKSTGELELFDYLKENYSGEVQNGNRLVIKPQELDIYFPNKKLAIEYCGLYWHNEDNKGKNYHLEKLNKCSDLNIRLIQIFEDEWLNSKDIVKEKLLYILNETKNKEKIYARNCYIKEINSKDKKEFLNKYHIQGNDSSNIRLGLYTKNDDTLVSVMTFCKPRIALGQNSKTTYDYELSRFASNYNYIVVGAFSKLFSYFKKNYKWNNLITYADKRWSWRKENLYEKNGWAYDHDSKPNYWYIENNHGTIRFHRFQFRKSKLKTLFPEVYDDNLTEREIMRKVNYKRIYDCGNMVFTYSR